MCPCVMCMLELSIERPTFVGNVDQLCVCGGGLPPVRAEGVGVGVGVGVCSY